MEHPMTIRAQEGEVSQLRLVAGDQFGNGYGVMTLNKAITERSIGSLKIKPACLALEPAMLSDGPLFSFPYERPIPFAQFVGPEQDAALRRTFVRIVEFVLN